MSESSVTDDQMDRCVEALVYELREFQDDDIAGIRMADDGVGPIVSIGAERAMEKTIRAVLAAYLEGWRMSERLDGKTWLGLTDEQAADPRYARAIAAAESSAPVSPGVPLDGLTENDRREVERFSVFLREFSSEQTKREAAHG